jgi:hypothetical protein
MSLQTSSHTSASWRTLGIVLLVAFAIVLLMALATAAFGVQVTGPFYDIVPDPAGLSGLPF